MKLINRYVSEVGKNLPLLKGREDIEKELRSTLEDMLEERAEKAGKPADEAMEIKLLKEYGSPQKVAETYNAHPYIIGPQMFPTFLMVLKIVIPIVVTVLLVLTGIQAVTETPFMGGDFVSVINRGLVQAIGAGINAFGYTVFIFAILERTLPSDQIKDIKFAEEKWDPASLAKEPDADSVKRSDLIAEIVFTFIGLAVINGMFNLPIFSDEFLKFVPWITAVSLAGIVLNIYLLRNAAWTPMTRIANILIDAAGIVITVMLLQTPNVFSFTTEILKNVPDGSSVDPVFLKRIVEISISGSLIIAIIVQGVEIAKSIFGLLRINYKTK